MTAPRSAAGSRLSSASAPWQSLSLLGYSARADEICSDSLSQIAADGELGEYFEPFTGKQLGSPQQSWTAAVTLDWSASDHGGEAS